MAPDEYLARLDAHLARLDENLAEMRAQNERGDQQYRELVERMEGEARLTREVVRRNELAFQEGSRMNAEHVNVLRGVTEDLRELGAEVRAQTEAIFRMLDRFDGGEPAGA
jgi:hypothetical protein